MCFLFFIDFRTRAIVIQPRFGDGARVDTDGRSIIADLLRQRMEDSNHPDLGRGVGVGVGSSDDYNQIDQTAGYYGGRRHGTV